MNARFISVLALLVITLFMFVACDDDPDTEPAPAAPLSDFEWTQTWYDVRLIGKPILTRIGDGITLPLRGAFDIVKVSPEGEELWRQAYDADYYSASSDNIVGFAATGRTLFNEEYFVEYFGHDGVPASRLVLNDGLPDALAVLRAPELMHGFDQISNEASRSRIRCRVMDTNPVTITSEVMYDHDGESHDFALCATADHNGGSILLGYYRPLESVPYSWPFLKSVAGNGELRWSYDHTHSVRDDLTDVIVLENGNIVAVGTSDYGTGDSHAQTVCLNPSGEILWLQEWDYDQDIENAIGVVETPDGILVAGNTWIDTHSEDPFLLLYSLDGDLLAQRVFDEDNLDYTCAVTKDYDGNIYICLRAEGGNSFSLSKLRQPIFPDL